MSALRLNNYPALTQAPLDGQLRAGEHCDYGSLTLLLPHDDEFNGRGDRSEDGLQVFIQGEWRPVVVPPGVFVVNIGDLMARWTNDTWRSTLHRVVVPQHDMEQQGVAMSDGQRARVGAENVLTVACPWCCLLYIRSRPAPNVPGVFPSTRLGCRSSCPSFMCRDRRALPSHHSRTTHQSQV